MKLVQPPEWYEKNLSDKSEECGAGNPEAYEQKCTDGIPNKPCIHCGTLMEDDGTESPICDECWEEMWEEREKENKKVEDNYYDYSLIMKGIRNGS